MRAVQIQIPTPCHEDWNNMLPEEKGRFCNSCAKTVVDFSVMSDQQLLDYLANFKNQSICGRLHHDQLDRNITELAKPKKKIFLYWQYIVAFVLMIARPSAGKAQGEIKSTLKGDTTIVEQRIETPVILGMIASRMPKTEKDIRKFRVVNDEQQPVAGASIEIKPSGKFITTDEDGWFTIPKKIKSVEVVVSSAGYQPKSLNPQQADQDVVVLEKEIQTIEAVEVKSSYETRIVTAYAGGMWVRPIRSISIRNAVEDSMGLVKNAISPLRLYPNPVNRGNSMKANLNLLLNNDYLLSVINTAGNLMLQKELSVAYQKSTLEIPIPASWAAGNYQVVLQNKKTGKKVTRGFIIL